MEKDGRQQLRGDAIMTVLKINRRDTTQDNSIIQYGLSRYQQRASKPKIARSALECAAAAGVMRY